MPKPKIRHYPTKGGLVSGFGNIRFVMDEKNRDPIVPEYEDNCGDGCNLFEDMGHHVHMMQVKAGIRKPLYKMKIVSTGPNYFIAVLNRKRIKFYTHRAPQMKALLKFYGPRLVGWLHEYSLFECQGYFFSVNADAEDFEECTIGQWKKRMGIKRVSPKPWVQAHVQPDVLRAAGDLSGSHSPNDSESSENKKTESKK